MSRPDDRPTLLIANGTLWPGNDASGPNLSIRAAAHALASTHRVKVIARDRPFGARHATATDDGWLPTDYGEIRYLPSTRLGAQGLARLLRETPHAALWLNGFFDRDFTLPALALRRLGRIPTRPTLLSPRGEFASGALGLKAARKSAYLVAARHLGLIDDITIHATSEHELADIKLGLPWVGHFAIAPNIRPLVTPAPAIARAPNAPLRIAFVGRISPVKNLDVALQVLASVTRPVAFTIYGPIQDAAYWAACSLLIDRLPAHVRVTHAGEVANDAIPAAMAATDLMFLPTKGENFGHAIFEALSCGVPVLISDQTPWRNLARREAGWDLPLEGAQSRARFSAAIDELAAMDERTCERLRRGARGCAEAHVAGSTAITATRDMIAAVTARDLAKPICRSQAVA